MIVLLLGALAVGQGDITSGTLVAFIILLLSLVWPIAALGVILAMAQEAMTAADRVQDIFDTEVRRSSAVSVSSSARVGHLRFEHVDFAFPDSDELVLRDVNLEVLPGETVAIVGATGSGKTALTAPGAAAVRRDRRPGARSTASTCGRRRCRRCARSSPPPSRSRRCSR